MKQKSLVLALSTIIFVMTMGCSDDFPSSPTVVTGKVIDDTGLPLSGILLQLAGSGGKGWAPQDLMFQQFDTTNNNGEFYFSQVVPENTRSYNIQTIKVYGPNSDSKSNSYSVTSKLNGKDNLAGGVVSLRREHFGKTFTIEFKLIKR